MRVILFIFLMIGGSLVYVMGFNMIWGGMNYSVLCGYMISVGIVKLFIYVIFSAFVVCVMFEGKDDIVL